MRTPLDAGNWSYLEAVYFTFKEQIYIWWCQINEEINPEHVYITS